MPAGMGFSKMGGLNVERAVTEYNEGGYDHTHKLAGREKVGEVTLERGLYASKELEQYYKNALTTGRGTLIIELLDRVGRVAQTWKLAEAWGNKREIGDFDAGSDDVAIEKITIQYEYLMD
jgi:phage tail-like protein